MDRIPVHLRITGLGVSNEDVDSRRKAVRTIAGNWGKLKQSYDIVAKAGAIADSLLGDGTPPPDLGTEVELAVQKHASAFLSSDRPLEVGICSANAALAVMAGDPGTGGWTIADVYSNALWLGLSFDPPLADEKREELREEVLERARERSLESANRARERNDVPDAGDLEIAVDDESVSTNFTKAIGRTIESLRRNAALDREELDFLWWAQLNRSRVLDRRLVDMPEATRVVATAIEGASMLRRLPADVHREIVLRTVDEDPEINLAELIEVLGDDRQGLASQFPSKSAAASARVFPLLNALISGSADGPGATVKRKASDWGSRALLEAGLAGLIHNGPANL